LKLSLITVPVRVFSATTPAGEVRFRQLHEKCGTPIQLKKWCPHCKEEVDGSDLAKGFELRKGSFVMLEQADIKAVKPQATHTVEVSRVIDAAGLDLLLIDQPFYMVPDGAHAGAAFSVLRDGLEGKAAIGTIVMHNREHVVALMPHEGAFRMFTMRRADEVRSLRDLQLAMPSSGKVKAEELKLAKSVLASFEGALELQDYPDEYEAALRRMIRAKAAGKEIVEPEVEKPTNVVNLLDALRKSLASAKAKRRPMSGAARRKAPVVQHKPKRRSA
jgi:DNA end-binding protein Ku